MMAYDNGFVICVLQGGSPVREINGYVSLPFNSDYKIRIKSKRSALRTKARVWIDGRKVSNLGDFILNPGETLDLERFLDYSMSEGNKFKFVTLEDSRVNDPTDSENGIIKVEFYSEKQTVVLAPPMTVIPFKKEGDTRTQTGKPSWSNTSTNTYKNLNYAVFSQTISSPNMVAVNYCNGATVEGGHSGQQFVHTTDFETEIFPVTITLRLRGISKLKWNDEINSYSQKNRRKVIRFCPHCGSKRQRVSNHFCSRCGTAYHPRYENERGKLSR